METSDIWIYYLKLPEGIKEVTISCCGGYTVWIDERLSDEEKEKAYRHAMWHIEHGDLDYNCTKSVQEIEWLAHKMEG